MLISPVVSCMFKLVPVCFILASRSVPNFSSVLSVNVLSPLIVCAVVVNTVMSVPAPADDLNSCTLYAFTVVLAPDVLADATVTVDQLNAAVNDS